MSVSFCLPFTSPYATRHLPRSFTRPATALDVCYEILNALSSFGIARAEDLQRVSTFEFLETHLTIHEDGPTPSANASPESDVVAQLDYKKRSRTLEGMLRCIGDTLQRHLCNSQRELRVGDSATSTNMSPNEGGIDASISQCHSSSSAAAMRCAAKLQQQTLRGDGVASGGDTLLLPHCVSQHEAFLSSSAGEANRANISVLESDRSARVVASPSRTLSTGSVRSETTRYHRNHSSSVYGSVVFNRPEVSETNRVVIGRDEDDNKVINDYVILGELGRGSFGKVKLAEHAVTKTVHAIKIVKAQTLAKRAALSRGGADGSVRDKLLREIAVMKKVAHPNLVQLHEVMSDEEKGKIYMVMQYIPCGTIAVKTSPTTVCPVEPTLLRKYAAQMISALRALHRNGIFHRDVKPDNILLGEHDCVYVADFGVSVICSEDGVSGVEGTPAFMAPELCRGELSVGGEAVDAWALGVTLFQLMYGVLPFHGETHLALTRRIVNDELVFPEREGVEPAPDGFVELLRGLLTKDPSQRWSLRQASRCTWIRGTEPSLQLLHVVQPTVENEAEQTTDTPQRRFTVQPIRVDVGASLTPAYVEEEVTEGVPVSEDDIKQALSPAAVREFGCSERLRTSVAVARRLLDDRESFIVGRALKEGVITPAVLSAATTPVCTSMERLISPAPPSTPPDAEIPQTSKISVKRKFVRPT